MGLRPKVRNESNCIRELLKRARRSSVDVRFVFLFLRSSYRSDHCSVSREPSCKTWRLIFAKKSGLSRRGVIRRVTIPCNNRKHKIFQHEEKEMGAVPTTKAKTSLAQGDNWKMVELAADIAFQDFTAECVKALEEALAALQPPLGVYGGVLRLIAELMPQPGTQERVAENVLLAAPPCHNNPVQGPSRFREAKRRRRGSAGTSTVSCALCLASPKASKCVLFPSLHYNGSGRTRLSNTPRVCCVGAEG